MSVTGFKCSFKLDSGLKAGALIIAVFFISLEGVKAQSHDDFLSAWLDNVNILAWKDWPAAAPTTGGTWGFEIPYDWGCDLCLEAALDHYDALNGVYMSSMQFTPTQQEAMTLAHGCLNLAGDVLGHDENAVDQQRAFAVNMHHPETQDIIEASTRQVVDAGAAGMTIDGYWSSVTGVELGGCFDDYTMDDFTEYLGNEYSAQALQERFGLNSLQNFNYKQWILDNNRHNSWSGFPYRDLSAEWYISEWAFSRQYLSSLMTQMDTYADQNYERKFLITENNAGGHFITTDLEPVISSEVFYFLRGGGFLTDYAATQVKLSKAFDKPVAILAEVCSSTLVEGEELSLAIPQAPENLMKFIISDIYASGGWISAMNIMPQLRKCGSGETSYQDSSQWYDMSAGQQAYYPFILDNSYLFEDLETEVRVGLLYSIASELNENIIYSDTEINQRFRDSHQGVSKMLMEGNIQHDMVIFGDPRFSPFNADLAKLADYDLIVAPNVYSISQFQADDIVEYVDLGGTVLSYGVFGITDEREMEVPSGMPAAWTSAGEHTYGAGKFITVSEDLGQEYNTFYNAAVKQRVLEQIVGEIPPLLAFDKAQQLMAFLYEKQGTSEKIIHIRNNAFDPEQDAFTASDPTILRMDASSKDYDAYYYSPDESYARRLSTGKDGEDLIISLPSIEGYGIVLLQEPGAAETAVWTATYDPASKTLSLPSIRIRQNVYYDVSLNLVNNSPIELELATITAATRRLTSSTYDPVNRVAHIPRFYLGEKSYSADLVLIPGSSPLRFTAENITLITE